MLDVSAKNLMEEVRVAINLRREITSNSEKQIELYAGSNWRSTWASKIDGDVNHPFEFAQTVLPSLVYSNPKVEISSRRPRIQRELVSAMQHGLNRWIDDVDLACPLQDVALDMIFDFGVILTTLEPLPGYERKRTPPMRPCAKRISPRRFFMDHKAGNSPPRFMGHAWVRDKEDILKAKNPDGSNKFNHEVVKKLADDTDASEFQNDDIQAFEREISEPSRKQIVGYEIWVPETGMIYTIAFSSGDGKKGEHVYLREPRKAFCPPWGPYTVFGMFNVPDQAYPLSPLAATSRLVEEINAHRAQTRRQADVSRKYVIVDSQNPGMVNAITTFADGSVIAMPNFSKESFAEIEFGGPSEMTINYIGYLQDELERRSGITDITKGQVSGATATEVNEATSGQDQRLRFMQSRFRRAVRQVLRSAAWFMFECDSVVFPMPAAKADEKLFEHEQEADQAKDGLFLGGRQPGQEDFSFFDLELEIEPYSMEMVDQAVLQRRMQSAYEILLNSAQQIPATPFINWPALLDDYFQSMNIKDGRKYVDWQKLEQFMQAQFTAGQPAQVPGLDGTPAIRTDQFKQHPSNAPQSETPQEPPTGGRTVDMAALLGAANSGAAA